VICAKIEMGDRAQAWCSCLMSVVQLLYWDLLFVSYCGFWCMVYGHMVAVRPFGRSYGTLYSFAYSVVLLLLLPCF